MRRIFTSIAPTVVTAVAGFITLVSFFDFLARAFGFHGSDLASLRIPLIDIAVIVAGVAVVMGFVHLLYVHSQRLRRRQSVFYSAIVIITAVVTLVILFVDRATSPDQAVTRFIFNNLIGPLQASLGALLAVFLALAAVRMLRTRRGFGAIWFLLAALIVLITQVPLTALGGLLKPLMDIRIFFDAITTGGLRGLLLGVALGTIATAFRVLFFIDRPQSE